MAQQEVKVFFKVDGLDGYITDLNQLQDALADVNKDTEELNEQVEDIGKSKSKTSGFFSVIKGKGVLAFKALKGAIAATGIGLLLTGLAQLVVWFKESDTGAKILTGTTAALGAIWTQLQNAFFEIIALFKPLFEDPLQSIKNFGQSIVDNIVERFNALFDTIGFLGTAIKKLFEGDFSGAAESAREATDSLLNGVIGLDDIVETVTSTVTTFGEVATKVFNETVDAVVTAVEASNTLVDRQNELRKLQQDLLVENAKLNQELETQQKIADDTTRSYDERKAALDRVNAANEQLADNAVKLNTVERDTLVLAEQLANTDGERRDIKDNLAEANAALIDSETQSQIVRLESAQLSRELDQEELDRKQGLIDEEIELNKERNDAVIEADEALAQAKANSVAAGIQLLNALAGDNEKALNTIFAVDKALAVAQVIVNAAKAKGANLAYAAALGPAGPAYLASANAAVNLNAGIQLASIAAATITKFKSGGAPPPSPDGGPSPSPNPAGAIAFTPPDQQGFQQLDANVTGVGQNGNGTPVRTYVLAGDVTSAQEADAAIQNLATL